MACKEITPEDEATLESEPLSPNFIESVILYTKNIYLNDFEQKKAEMTDQSQRDNLKVEDVYDEFDQLLFEELEQFTENYNNVNQILYQHLISLCQREGEEEGEQEEVSAEHQNQQVQLFMQQLQESLGIDSLANSQELKQ